MERSGTPRASRANPPRGPETRARRRRRGRPAPSLACRRPRRRVMLRGGVGWLPSRRWRKNGPQLERCRAAVLPALTHDDALLSACPSSPISLSTAALLVQSEIRVSASNSRALHLACERLKLRHAAMPKNRRARKSGLAVCKTLASKLSHCSLVSRTGRPGGSGRGTGDPTTSIKSLSLSLTAPH